MKVGKEPQASAMIADSQSAVGTPITPRNMLRHTTASPLLEKNVHPKIVSELLGHSTVTLTLNTYSHIINPISGAAAEAMDEIVGQTR